MTFAVIYKYMEMGLENEREKSRKKCCLIIKEKG